MWTEGGQLDLLSFHGVYKKGGSSPQPQVIPGNSYVDPVDGTVYSDPPNYGGMYSPFNTEASAADRLNQHIRERQANEQAASAAKQAQADQAAAGNETTFQNTKQSAYDNALQSIIRRFQLEGVDPNAYMTSDIVPTLKRQFDAIPDLDPNPASAFPTSLGDTILSDLTSGRRTSVSNQLNSTFDPNYSSRLIPDSTIDQYAPTIVNEQFDPLMSQLQNAQKRHTLNDTGYNAALAALNQKKSAALSTVGDLGRTILGTDRSHIDDIISGARNTASGLTLGQQFDPSSYVSQASGRATSDLSNFGGALRSAVGDTKFADLTELLNAGGSVQGATNPNAANPTGGINGSSPFFTDPEEDAQKKRGLGNTGAF